MVKLLKKYWWLVPLALLAALIVITVWAIATPQGARWVIATISARTPVNIAADKIEGRLIDKLTMERLSVSFPGGEAEAANLAINWRPVRLFIGQLSFSQISGDHLHIKLAETKAPKGAEPLPPWPRVTGLLAKLHADIDEIDLHDLSISRGSKPLIHLDGLRSRLKWRSGNLNVSNLAATAKSWQIGGDVAAGFQRPSISADIKADFLEKDAPIQSMALVVQGKDAGAKGLLAGTFSAEGEIRNAGRVRSSGEFLVLQDGIQLRSFTLSSSQVPGKLDGEADMRVGSAGVAVDGKLELQHIDVVKVTGFPTNLSGKISINWQQGRYRGKFSLVDKVSNRPRLAGSATYEGDSRRMAFTDLSGNIEKGYISGTAAVTWVKEIEASADLDVNNMDPALLYPTWPGKIAAGLEGSVKFAKNKPPTVSFAVDFKPSELRGRYFRGDASGNFSNNDLSLSRLRIFGDSFTVAASGILSERIDFSASVSKLEVIEPKIGGAIAADGWLKMTGGDWFGSMSGSGERITFAGATLASLTFAASRESFDEKPFVVEIHGIQASHEDFSADSANFVVRGTPVQHQGSLSATWHDGSAEAAVTGSFAASSWTGTISSLTYRKSDVGSWHAVAPFVASISAQHASLSPFELLSIAGEEIKGSLALSLSPLRGQAELAWNNVDLSDANPFLDDFLLAGKTSGAVDARWPNDGGLAFAGWAEAGGRIALEQQDIFILQALTDIDWDKKGLGGSAKVTLTDGGIFSAKFSSDQRARFGLPSKAKYELDWDDFNLGIVQPWLQQVTLAGKSSGRVRGNWWENGRLDLAALASGTAIVGYADTTINIRSVETEIDWDQHGLKTSLQAFLDEGGEIQGSLTSKEPSRLQLPQDGEATLSWKEINISLLKKWIPQKVNLLGTVSGKSSAKIIADGRFEIEGTSAVSGGEVSWNTDRGVLSAALRRADIGWDWRGNSLDGSLAIVLEDYGKVDGTFSLPASARLPVAIEPNGPVKVALQCSVKEQGLLSAIVPGLVDETRGNLMVALTVDGTWSAPQLGGQIQVADAAASVPVAGISISGTSLNAHLEGDKIFIDNFRALSGPGFLAGTGELKLQAFRIADYQLKLQGEKFQVVHLPELQLQASPNLQFSGNPDKMVVRGDIVVPELLVLGRQGKGPVEASPDVIIVDAPQPPEHQLPVALDLQVRILFGDRVLIKAYGIDAKLGGSVIVKAAGLDGITGQGEIKVEKGTYATYGVKLDIAHGSLIFAGGPINEPSLDILALRTIKEAQAPPDEEVAVKREVIKAGVQITGTTAAPVIKLYSDPAMPDTDILAYIVLGHPLGQDPAQADLLMLAAGALLSKGESVVLQERLKKTLGLDVLEIQSGGSDIAQSIVTVGKYLSPRLYISYGRYLFTGINEFRLRYLISKSWEIQSRSGIETGVDLFYRIQFR